jgi:hypothetical protein
MGSQVSRNLKLESTGPGASGPSLAFRLRDISVDGSGTCLRLAAKTVIEWRNEGCFLPQPGCPRANDDRQTIAGRCSKCIDRACAHLRGSRAWQYRTNRRNTNNFKQCYGFPGNQAPCNQALNKKAENLGQAICQVGPEALGEVNREQGGTGSANGEDSSGLCGLD